MWHKNVPIYFMIINLNQIGCTVAYYYQPSKTTFRIEIRPKPKSWNYSCPAIRAGHACDSRWFIWMRYDVKCWNDIVRNRSAASGFNPSWLKCWKKTLLRLPQRRADDRTVDVMLFAMDRPRERFQRAISSFARHRRDGPQHSSVRGAASNGKTY